MTKPLGTRDAFYLILIVILTFGAIIAELHYSVITTQKRIDVLSEKVKVLEYQVKDSSGEHVYTSSIKETI